MVLPTLEELNHCITFLYDIINCAQDLDSHCSVEDSIFVPAVGNLENEIRERGDYIQDNEEEANEADDDKTDILSVREKEIIICIAKGLVQMSEIELS